MNANEIMIGDWLRHRWTCCNTGREVVMDFQLAAIQKIGESLYAWSKGGNAGNIEDIEPIPLTDEILEKNGFAEDEMFHTGMRFRQADNGTGIVYEVYWDSMGFFLEISANIFQIGEFSKNGIKYVHQLQHALRLCGIEKDIVL